MRLFGNSTRLFVDLGELLLLLALIVMLPLSVAALVVAAIVSGINRLLLLSQGVAWLLWQCQPVTRHSGLQAKSTKPFSAVEWFHACQNEQLTDQQVRILLSRKQTYSRTQIQRVTCIVSKLFDRFHCNVHLVACHTMVGSHHGLQSMGVLWLSNLLKHESRSAVMAQVIGTCVEPVLPCVPLW